MAINKKSFMEFAGAWSFMSDNDTEEMINLVNKMRKNWRSLPE
ncbi:MAG: hypothetical protein Q7S22_05575 [Candidatus Micrarchaeota archaeon]|nr:hypothetical protein [Candidatus Micrarchaeota archaeon]